MAGQQGEVPHQVLIDVIRFEVPVLLREGPELLGGYPEELFQVSAVELYTSILLQEYGVDIGPRRGRRIPDVLFTYDGGFVLVEVGDCQVDKWHPYPMIHVGFGLTVIEVDCPADDFVFAPHTCLDLAPGWLGDPGPDWGEWVDPPRARARFEGYRREWAAGRGGRR